MVPIKGNIPYHQDTRQGFGASLFASLNTHLGIECSPRDDLSPSPTCSSADHRRDAKLTAQGTLTHTLPREFGVLHAYACELPFSVMPDYAFVRDLLRGLGEHVGVHYPDDVDSTSSSSARGGGPEGWGGFDLRVGSRTPHHGRVCEACKKRAEAAWA